MRGAKASLHLELFAQAARLADMGLKAASVVEAEEKTKSSSGTHPSSSEGCSAETAELRALLQDAEEKHRRHQERRREAEAKAGKTSESKGPSAVQVLTSRGTFSALQKTRFCVRRAVAGSRVSLRRNACRRAVSVHSLRVARIR